MRVSPVTQTLEVAVKTAFMKERPFPSRVMHGSIKSTVPAIITDSTLRAIIRIG